MKAVLQMFWQICLFRQSPARVPAESWFVAVVVAANLLVSVVVSVAIDETADPLTVITRVVVGQATYASLVWLATYLREFPGRFATTLTALFGCDLIITVVFGVLEPLARTLGDPALSVLSLGFMIWSLAVAGFILSRALNVRMGIGVLLALGITVFTVAAGFTAAGG